MPIKEQDPARTDHYAMSLRVKPNIGRLLEDTARKMGMSKTAVIVAALHDYARKVGVTVGD